MKGEINQLDMSLQDAVIATDIQSFIPAVGHYDQHLLITQDADLLCIISIDGNPTTVEAYKQGVRNQVRASMRKNITSYKISAHIHVVREKHNIVTKGQALLGPALVIEKAWNQYNNWSEELVNNLYLTITYQRALVRPFSLKSVIPSLVASRTKKYLATASVALHDLADSICKDLQSIGAQKLGIITESGKVVSQPLSFFYYLTHLQQMDVFPSMADYSIYLADYQMWCGFNSMKISHEGKDRHAVIYSFKEMPYVPDLAYEELMNVDCNFIISEVMVFSDHKSVRETFAEHVQLLQMGQEMELAENIGLIDAVSNDNIHVADNCFLQSTLLCYAQNTSELKDKIDKLSRFIAQAGLIAIREDYSMMRCFWAMLPGNIRFLSRTKLSTLNRSANFASIHHHDVGHCSSKWGKYIALLRSIKGRKFCFNFHDRGEDGHTIFVGPNDSGKSTLVKFLLAQIMKLGTRIIIIDQEASVTSFIEKLGGLSWTIAPDKPSPLSITPFVGNISEDPKTLQLWIAQALGMGQEQASDHNSSIRKLINKLDGISDATEMWQEFLKWHSDNKIHGSIDITVLENLFSKDNLSALKYEHLMAINLRDIKDPNLRIAFLLLLLFKIEESILDGEPTIISINQSENLLNSQYTDIITSWLDRVSGKNALVFLQLASNKELESKPEIIQTYLDKCPTKMFAVNNFVAKKFKNAYDLSESEFKNIKNYSTESRLVLIKQGQMAVVAFYQFEKIAEIIKIIT